MDEGEGRAVRAARQLQQIVARHGRTLWWLHSVWALLFGAAMMWLGSHHFAYLRVAVVHVAFIWVASLTAQRLHDLPASTWPWCRRIRSLIHYLNRNFYQQILFFLLPVYYASTTFWSPNAVFLLLVGAAAILSTLDLVYDEQLVTRRLARGLFLAFSLFATVGVMLPVLWALDTVTSLRLSAAVAFAAFATAYHDRRGTAIETLVVLALVAALLAVLVERGRALIPPVPLRLVSSEFGTDVDPTVPRVTVPLHAMPADGRRVYVLTAIAAPLGLRDGVRHRWFRDGQLFYESPAYPVAGGRSEGYRLWTFATPGPGVAHLRVDILTAAGQLIGRAGLP